MKKTIAIVCGVLCLGVCSVFGGEFVSKEFVKLKNANDLAGMKAYIENNNQCSSKKLKDHANMVYAKYTVMCLVDKIVTTETAFKTITDIVDQQPKLTDAEKTIVKAHVYRVANWPNKNVAIVKLTKNSVVGFATNENIITIKQNPINKLDVWFLYSSRPDFDKLVTVAAEYGPYFATNRLRNMKSVKDEDKITVINILTDRVNEQIKTPGQLENVVKTIKTLNDPKFDAAVKRLLVVLNRHCYPKIQESEQWKKAVVQLQLIMKSYSL